MNKAAATWSPWRELVVTAVDLFGAVTARPVNNANGKLKPYPFERQHVEEFFEPWNSQNK